MKTAWRIALPAAALAALVVVLATAPSGADDAPKASIRSQSLFMVTPWEAVSPAETRVSITGDDPVLKRNKQQDPRRKLYSEAMQLRNGAMQFERRRSVPEAEILPAAEELVKRYGNSRLIQAAQIKLDKDQVKTRSLESGDLNYVVLDVKTNVCAYYFMYSNRSVMRRTAEEDANYQAISGTYCTPAGSSLAAVENDMVDLVSRVRFDDGRFARTKLFAAALSQLHDKPLAEDVEPDVKTAVDDHRPPVLNLAAVFRTDRPEVVISGTVRDAKPVEEARVAHHWTPVVDGRFEITVPAAPGVSKLPIEVVDTFGNKAAAEVTVERNGGADGTPGNARIGNFHALVIGIKDYKSPIPRLDTPVNDAHALANVLQTAYGFQVTALDNPRKEDIVAAIETLQRTLTASDNLLIYYAGHGVLDPDTNLGYWLPIDATVDSPANWISNKFVAKLIRGIPAKHVIVVADACYSGSFARGELLSGSGITDVDQLVWLRSRTAFSSGDLEEVLDAGGGNNSLFAHHFLAALNGNTGTVNGIQLAGEVRALVRKEASQTPQYGAVPSAGHDEGADFLFIKRK